jgi:hypothetical protein
MQTLMNMMAMQGFLPHGYCFQWSTQILTMMVASDFVTALAYFSIPLALLALVDARQADIKFKSMFFLFSCFIFFCGTTHIFDIITIWYPAYYIQAYIKVATAIASALTAVLLWPLVRKLNRIPLLATNLLEAELAAAHARILELENAQQK